MLSLDKAGIDKLLIQLEQKAYIDPGYHFYKVNNELILLGCGAFSYVYEMYDSTALDRHYAAKIIGLSGKPAEPDMILETAQIQYFLSEQSENIMRVIALWTMKLFLDESGEIQGIIGVNEEGFADADGVLLQIVLMERLDNIVSKDKYGNIELLRDDLKTEAGVIKFAENIGRALFAVHNHNILHRDIKLENIFWDPNIRQYKLGDFGIARYVENGDAETVVFTDGYGAPEIEKQLGSSYNAAADIYSFGITLYLLLNNFRFPASDGYHASAAQYTKDFIVPAPENASERMSKIIRKMCSYRAEERYQSVEEVLIDIGRLDGSYTDQGFTEYDDLPTETYRDGGDDSTETYREPERDIPGDLPGEKKEELSWRNKADSELNREERKKKAQLYGEMYMESSVIRMCLSAVLFFLLFKAFSPDVAYVRSWQFWILPAALFIGAVLKQLKEFYIEFEVLVVALALFSAYSIGIHLPIVVIMIAVVLGIPAISAGCAIGTGLWIAQILTGKMAWLSILSKWDLGWIILLALAAVIESYVILRADHNRASMRDIAWVWILEKLCYLLMIAGMILFLLEKFNVMILPEMIKHLHPVRTGIGIFIIQLCCLSCYNVLDDDDHYEDDEIDESVDE